jgi:adenylate kinase family enzyme
VVAPRKPVLILTGAPGSGKTTVAHLLAKRAERAVHVESDRFFRFIVSGYVQPWKRESHEQNTVVMQVVGDAAVGYAKAGYETIVDGVVTPGTFFEPLRDAIAASGFGVAYAVLRPPLSVAVERAAGRPSASLSDAAVVEQLWNAFAELGPLERHAVAIDERQSAADVAESVDERLRAGELSV